MEAATLVRNAKAESKKSHRALAVDADVAASTITRVQSQRIEPTVDVLERILGACGYALELRAVRKGSPPRPHLDDLVEAWEPQSTGGPRLAWTRWRAWLDALARHPDWVPEAIYQSPSPSGHGVIDALLAAVAEKLADDSGLPRPSWTAAVPAVEPPYEPPARRRGEIEERFERRGLMIDTNSLFRAGKTLGV